MPGHTRLTQKQPAASVHLAAPSGMFCAAWSGVKRIGAAEEVKGRRSRWKMDMLAIVAGDVSSSAKARRMQGMRIRKETVVNRRGSLLVVVERAG